MTGKNGRGRNSNRHAVEQHRRRVGCHQARERRVDNRRQVDEEFFARLTESRSRQPQQKRDLHSTLLAMRRTVLALPWLLPVVVVAYIASRGRLVSAGNNNQSGLMPTGLVESYPRLPTALDAQAALPPSGALPVVVREKGHRQSVSHFFDARTCHEPFDAIRQKRKLERENSTENEGFNEGFVSKMSNSMTQNDMVFSLMLTDSLQHDPHAPVYHVVRMLGRKNDYDYELSMYRAVFCEGIDDERVSKQVMAMNLPRPLFPLSCLLAAEKNALALFASSDNYPAQSLVTPFLHNRLAHEEGDLVLLAFRIIREVNPAMLADVLALKDSANRNILMLALDMGMIGVAERILDVIRNSDIPLDQQREIIFARGCFGRTSAHLAARLSAQGIVDALMAIAPALATQVDDEGNTPKDLFATHTRESLEEMLAFVSIDGRRASGLPYNSYDFIFDGPSRTTFPRETLSVLGLIPVRTLSTFHQMPKGEAQILRCRENSERLMHLLTYGCTDDELNRLGMEAWSQFRTVISVFRDIFVEQQAVSLLETLWQPIEAARSHAPSEEERAVFSP